MYHILGISFPGVFPGGSDGKESTCSAGDPGSIPRKIPWRREQLPTPISCLENSMDKGAWWVIITKSQTRLSD